MLFRSHLLYVLVIGGRVEKDAVGLADFDQEIRRLGERPGGDQVNIILHESARATLARSDPAVAEAIQPYFIDVSVRDRLDRDKAPRLVPIDEIESVKRWNKWWRLVRIALWTSLLTVLVAGGIAATLWFLGREPDTPQEVAVTGPNPSESEYDVLLRTPDPGVLMQAIHRAYREFLGDRLFGRYWNVVNLKWARQEYNADARRWLPRGDVLEIKAALPVDASDDAAAQAELTDELQAEIRAYAESRGWRVELAGREATFWLPVRAEGRGDEEADHNRRPLPREEENRWHQQRLIEDLRYLGATRIGASDANRVFTSYQLILQLQDAEWARSDIVDWLAKRLADGPAFVESLMLAQDGVSVTGEIKLRTVWCLASQTQRCAKQT